MPESENLPQKGVMQMIQQNTLYRRLAANRSRETTVRACRDSVKVLLALRNVVRDRLLDEERFRDPAFDLKTMKPVEPKPMADEKQNLWAFISGIGVLEEAGFFDEVLALDHPEVDRER